MFENWLLNSLSVFLSTVAALLIFLAHRQLPMAVASLAGYEKLRFEQQHRRLSIALGLLAAWLVIQCLPFIYP